MSTNLNNLQTNLKSQKKLLDCGQKMVKLKQSKPMEDIEDISTTKKQIIKKPNLNLSTPESLQKNNNQTLRDKLNIFKNYTQSIESSLISVPVSISIEKDLTNYWKQSSQEQLQKLWLPIKTACVDLDLNSLKTFANISPQLSQLSTIKIANLKQMNLQKTCCLSLQFSQQDFMDKENIQNQKEEEILYVTRKFRIYPKEEQKKLFNKCLNATRFFYNKANEYVKKINNNKESEKKSEKKIILPSAIKIRENVLTSDSKLTEKDKWQKDIPYDTRELAIRRLHKSYNIAFSLLRTKNIKTFDIKYKKKKNNKQSFEINKNAIKITKNGDFRIFPSRLKEKIRVRKRDRNKIKKLKMDKPHTNTMITKEYNRWYICINIPKEDIKEEKEKPIFSSVFLDPGTRKFQNFYSPDGICGHIGDRFCKKEITPLINKYEEYQKIIGNKNKQINKKGLWKRCYELITKVKHKVSDMHNQTANFLSTTFESIFIPIFETRKMVDKDTRKITKKTVKELINLSYYKFRNKLADMCKIRGNKYKVITEEYTSKTCTSCGKINKKLGGKEEFNCEKCKLEIDRDINASRNICIKNIKGYGAIPQK